MCRDAAGDQRARQWLARGRIEFAKPAPHAAMLMVADEHRTMRAGTALRMAHAHVPGQQNLVTRIARAPTQIQILAMQEVTVVEPAQPLECRTRQQHQRAGYVL